MFALALAAVVVSRAGWFHRFEVDGVKINPRAPVRDDVTYDLVVWEEAVVAPWAKETHAEHLERAVLEFSRQRPNVRVTVQMLDEETARERLEAAVAAGAPPDVYGAVKGVLWAWPYQVPASPYMPVDQGAEPLPVDPRALAGLTAAGAVWGWPRGLWWDGWLGRRELAISDDWTYGSLLQGGTGPSSPDRITVSLDLTSVQLLEQLMGAAGTPSYVDGHGQGAWDRSGLAETAAFLRSLQQSRGPGGDMDAAARRRLENLLAGDVDLIGPVNPYAVQSALRHAPDRFDHRAAARPPRFAAGLAGGGQRLLRLSPARLQRRRPHAPGRGAGGLSGEKNRDVVGRIRRSAPRQRRRTGRVAGTGAVGCGQP